MTKKLIERFFLKHYRQKLIMTLYKTKKRLPRKTHQSTHRKIVSQYIIKIFLKKYKEYMKN